jgi:hypothetical protein
MTESRWVWRHLGRPVVKAFTNIDYGTSTQGAATPERAAVSLCPSRATMLAPGRSSYACWMNLGSTALMRARSTIPRASSRGCPFTPPILTLPECGALCTKAPRAQGGISGHAAQARHVGQSGVARPRLRGYQEIIDVSDSHDYGRQSKSWTTIVAGASQGIGAPVLPGRRSGGLPWLIPDRRIEKRLAE